MGRPRKTEKDYHELAAGRDFQWVGDLPANTFMKTAWQCLAGHIWTTHFQSIQSGRGCPPCSHARSGDRTRKTADEYHAIARVRGFAWLGPTSRSVSAKTAWQCAAGHAWDTSYNNIQQGYGCPYCSGRILKTADDYHEIATLHGFLWTGALPLRSTAPTAWMCSVGHTWQAAYQSIKAGNGCHECSGRARKTPDDYHALAHRRGFRWVGLKVESTTIKTEWECSKGHRWMALYGNIKHGTGCPRCAHRIPKAQEDYHALAQEKGFRWVAEITPETTQAKTLWRCRQDHQWSARYGDIYMGDGCPHCSGRARKTAEDYHRFAAERGLKWVGFGIPTVMTATEWECAQGHRFTYRYNDIQQRGSDCPACADIVNGAPVSKPQRIIAEMLGGELNAPCGRYRIDVACAIGGRNIAIEYDSWHWHVERRGDQSEAERKRDGRLVKKGWRVLRIKSRRLLPTKDQLDEAIGKLLAGELQTEIVLADWGVKVRENEGSGGGRSI